MAQWYTWSQIFQAKEIRVSYSLRRSVTPLQEIFVIKQRSKSFSTTSVLNTETDKAEASAKVLNIRYKHWMKLQAIRKAKF